jgi:diamine N-acetyltransferase
MHTVTYRTSGIDEIDLIRPLWEQLNAYHHARASSFKAHYEQMIFEDRKLHFFKVHGSGELRLDLALDTGTGGYVGYCVSSISAEKDGEVESLFVDAAYRSEGIGTVLLTRGLAWMDARGVKRKRVSVGNGNEPALAFYRKFKFYPRMTVLEQKTEPD